MTREQATDTAMGMSIGFSLSAIYSGVNPDVPVSFCLMHVALAGVFAGMVLVAKGSGWSL